jgi:anti-sigma B factor antagonist
MQIGVDVTERGRWRVVAVEGEIDITTAPQFRESLFGVIDQGNEHVVVDLTGVEFLDSTALGVMVGAHKRLREGGPGLVVACDQPSILRVLDVTGLSTVFRVCESVDAAVAV